MEAIGMKMPVIAGTISTTIFALSMLPMVWKAWRTKDLRSYSLESILLTNVANVVHSVYVFDLPAGPIWVLHSFYLLVSAALLVLYLRHEWRPMCGWLWSRMVQLLRGNSAVPGGASCPA